MFPYEIKPIGGVLNKELQEYFKGFKSGNVLVGPKKWFFTKKYTEFAEDYYNFELRQDDIWVMSFPRSGTTLMQEIVWLINNNLDFDTASKVSLFERVPFFEYDIILDDKFIADLYELNKYHPNIEQEIVSATVSGFKMARKMSSPRHFKTHLAPSLLPPKLLDTCKVVYVARNPYDAAVSYYHHNKLFQFLDYQGDFNQYWDFFEKDRVLYSPYWENIKEGWNLRNHPNFLFLFYEDLIKDMPYNIRKISQFLNKEITNDGVDKLAKHVHIDNFRKLMTYRTTLDGYKHSNAQNFIRKGQIGGNEEITGEIKTRIDNWFKENLSKTDIKFPKF